MNKFLKAIEKKGNELELISSRRTAAVVREAQTRHEGYVQGISDMMDAITEITLDQTKYKE